MPSASLTRAQMLRAGGGLLVAGTGLALVPVAGAALPDGDLAYLRVLVGVELLTADFQAQALAGGRPARSAAALLRQGGRDDKAHYAALGALLHGAGQPPTTAADIDFAYPRGAFASRGSILRLGATLSTLSLGAYLGAVENVQTQQLRLPIGQIAANEAQRLAAFSHLLGRPLVGNAFAAALPIAAVSAALDRYES